MGMGLPIFCPYQPGTGMRALALYRLPHTNPLVCFFLHLLMKGIKGSCHDVTLNILSSADIFQHSYQIASEFGEHTKLLKQRHNFGQVLFQGNNRVTLNKISNMSKQ